jgi:hypothetical protein
MEIYDKNVIEIDMGNSIKTDKFDATNYYCKFYMDILQPIRNAVYIKIMRTAIVLKADQAGNDAVLLTLPNVANDDAVYVRMNDYNRVSSVLIKSNEEPTVNKFFEMVHINLTKIYNLSAKYNASALTEVPSMLFSNEYSQSAFDPNDTSVHILKPLDPSLKRFTIELRDKNNALLKTSDVLSFKMTICVYSKEKKF